MVNPRALRPRMISKSRSASCLLKAEVGSSRISSFAWCDSACAMAISCRWAIGRSPARADRPDVDAKLGEDSLSPAVHFAPVDQPTPFREIVSEEDVLRRGQVGADGDLLVDDADAGGTGGERVGERDLASLEADRALVGRKDSAADADQRRLPRAVLADEGVNLAAGHGEAHPLQGAHAPEALADACRIR